MWKFLALPVSLFLMAATASLGPESVSLIRSHTSRCNGRFPALAALSVARSVQIEENHFPYDPQHPMGTLTNNLPHWR